MRKEFVFVIVKDEKEKKAVDKMIQIESESQQKALLKKLSKKSSKSFPPMQGKGAEWFETYIRPHQIERAERLKREKREEERRKKRKKKNKR